MFPAQRVDLVAEKLCSSRESGVVLAKWPGVLPITLDAAYAVQAAAIARWAQPIAGWKIGLMAEPARSSTGVDRWLGPVFAPSVLTARGNSEIPIAAVPGVTGFECELVFELAQDVFAASDWSEVAPLEALVKTCRIAIEITGCPVNNIGDLGSLACIAAFGNNAALVVGPEIGRWRSIDLDSITVRASIDGRQLREANPAALPGGVWTAFASALTQAMEQGIDLPVGTLISTGAITGLHYIQPGELAEADFGPYGRIVCQA